MKLSKKTLYAILLMLSLAKNEENGNVTMREISVKEGISMKYLEHIVNALCKSGLVKSWRGAHGGYRLSKDANEYTLGSIIRVTEGDISEEYIGEMPPLDDFWKGLYDTINKYMDSVTIGDLLEQEKLRNQIYDYYI
jgi:Rrf2 family protein